MRNLTAAVAACLVVLCGGLSAQTPDVAQIRLTPTELKLTARAALQTGANARALALAEALLLRDAQDPFALNVAARAALAVGQSDVAFDRAILLYDLSEPGNDRFIAARLAALAAAQADRFTTSQIWLRRAYQYASTQQDGDAVASDFAQIRAANPWSVTLDFGVSPSDNINNGTFEDNFDITILGTVITLPFNANQQELAGYEVRGSADIAYRLSQTQRRQTFMTFGASADLHSLTRESRARAPDFDTSDLNTWRLQMGVKHDWAMGNGDVPTSAALTYEATFVGGDLFARSVQLTGAQRWAVRAQTSLTGAVSFGQTTYIDADATSDLWAGNITWQMPAAAGHTLSATAGLGRSVSDAALYNSRYGSLGLTYDFGQVADAFDMSISATVRKQEYLSGNDVTRTDDYARLRLDIGMTQVDYLGFMPVLGFEAAKTQSTVSRFNTQSLSMDVGIRSRF